MLINEDGKWSISELYAERFLNFVADELALEREAVILKLNNLMPDHRIKEIEKNLKIAFGKPECKVCGTNPRRQKEILIQSLTQGSDTNTQSQEG
jgi:hypothetical protein